MKIGYLIPGCGVTGGIAVACQHTNRLLQRGHEVYLISETSDSTIDWFPRQQVPVLTLERYPENLDILIATGWSTAFKVVNLPARHKCYFVQSDETRFHEEGSFWQHLTAMSYLLSFHYFTEAKWIQKWLNDNFQHQVEHVPNGLDESIFFPDKPLIPKKKKPRILLEGAIDLPYKGMDDAFAAVENLDAEVWCISSLGKPKPEWRCDKFFNQVPMDQMRRIYSSCDVLLKLSRVEGFFGPPLEMMACGGTVVVGKVTGYNEYIIDGYNALVVEARDITAATEAVKTIILDRSLKKQLIKNGLLTAKAWRWESSINKLEDFFFRIMENQNNRSWPSIRELSDKGIAEAFQMATTSQLNYDDFQTTIFTEPIDKILYRIRKNNIAKRIANFIYKIYKLIK